MLKGRYGRVAAMICILGLFLVFGNSRTEAASISMNKTSTTIGKGSSVKLKVMQGGKAVSGAVWGSSDPSVASVSSSGRVTGRLKGSTVISAMYRGTTVECVVSVVNQATSKTVRYNVLVLDRSRSMRGSPMTQVKKAAKRFAKTVMKADGTNYVAVVSYGSDSLVVCDFTSSYKKVSRAISGISTSGQTNMRSAFAAARKLLKKAPSKKGVIKNLILCSDGLPQTGKKSSSGRYSKKDHKYYRYANSVYALDRKMKKKECFVYALGFFHNSKGKSLTFGKRLMKDLASKDKYYIIQDGKDISNTFKKIAKQIISVTLSDDRITIYEGNKKRLRAYLNGTKADAEWSSDDPSIASVTRKGVVKGIKPGITTVRARVKGRTVKCRVTVLEVPTNITLNKKKLTIYVDDTYKLKAAVTGKSGTVSWTCSDTSVLSLTGSGKTGTIKGLKPGTCTVTATCRGKKAQCVVRVKPLKDITDDFLLYGDAKKLEDGSIRLTECVTWQGGAAWYPKPLDTSKRMTVTFRYWAGGGREQSYGGADGIVLNLAERTGIGAEGGNLGFEGYYGVELDSYPRNAGDPAGKHVAVIQTYVSNHLSYKLDDRVDDSRWHTVKVTYSDRTLCVYLDGGLVLKQDEVDLKKNTYIGLTGATGDGINEHKVKEFKIR